MDFAEFDLDYYQLPQELKDTVQGIKNKMTENYYSLCPGVDIVDAFQESFPLVYALRFLPPYQMQEACADAINYITSKMKHHIEEVL